MSLSKNINPSLVLVQPRKTRPNITERLLRGLKESNQTKTKPKLATVFLLLKSVPRKQRRLGLSFSQNTTKLLFLCVNFEISTPGHYVRNGVSQFL